MTVGGTVPARLREGNSLTAPETAWVERPDGVRLAVHELGDGDPVLLVPGLGYASWSFARQLAPLAPYARVLAVDNRGTGRSGKPAGPYSIEQLADDAHAVLQERGAAPATVVGTSMGGYVAQVLALKYPHAVKSLVLVATTSGGRGAHGVPPETLRAWEEAAHLDAEGFARATMPLSFAPGWSTEHPSELEELLALRQEWPTPAGAWQAQFLACVDFLSRGLPDGDVPHPTVIVHGTADRVVPYTNAAHLAQRHPHATLHTMNGAGHLCWIERPDEFNRLVRTSISGGPTG